MNILLVEDSPGDMFLARRALARSPLEVELAIAQTGQEALNHLQGLAFDLVLLDINLWDMSGFEVLKQMNEREDVNTSPTYVLSTSRDPADKKQAEALGAIGFVSKPRSYGDYAQLVGTIGALLSTLERQPLGVS